MDCVGVRPPVREVHAQEVVLRRADYRPGNGSIVGPGRKRDAFRNLDVLVDPDQRVLTDTAGCMGLGGWRQQKRVQVASSARCGYLGTDHCRMAERYPLGAVGVLRL